MSVRNELAEAASTVEGVNASSYYRQSTKPGDAWIRLDRIELPNTFGGIAHWNVIVVLPQDQAAAEKYLERVWPALREALSPVMVVREAIPQRVNLVGIGDLPCLFINGHREEEG